MIIQKPKVPEYYLERGEAKQEKKFNREAIADYDKVVELDPDFEGPSKMAMLHKGEALRDLGQFGEAVTVLTTVMSEVDTVFPAAMALRGECYYKLGQYSKAVEQLDETISLDDESAEIAGWAFRFR